MPTSKITIELEHQLAQMHNRRFCLLVSRGTTAIYLALKVLGLRPGKVILPSILCLNPANAVIYAGLEPFFCDVNLTDYNLDIEDLKRILKTHRDVRCLILAHSFGQPGDIEEIVNITQKNRIALIEDVAQALGGEYKGKPLGSFGDISILSFGHTKIIDVGGGGAILFDRKEYLKDFQYHLKRLPYRIKNYSSLNETYRKVYYALASIVREDFSLGRLYYSFPYLFRDLYLYGDLKVEFALKLKKALKTLKSVVDYRNENAGIYRKYLIHPKIRHPHYRFKGVFWRYSFLIHSPYQQDIAQAIRDKGIDVSNWYPPVHLFYDLDPRPLRKAEYLGKHIFNLWVDGRLIKRDIRRNIDCILKILDQYERKG